MSQREMGLGVRDMRKWDSDLDQSVGPAEKSRNFCKENKAREVKGMSEVLVCCDPGQRVRVPRPSAEQQHGPEKTSRLENPGCGYTGRRSAQEKEGEVRMLEVREIPLNPGILTRSEGQRNGRKVALP